ncbi:hypothetical protein BH11MYX3_BH11MYX3_02920 [soil metagenome]
MLRSTHIAAIAIGLLAGTAAAHPQDDSPTDQVLPPPPTYKANGVTVDEHIGARIPLDAAFRTTEGTRVTLGELLQGELPTILTFNYSDCPMLCSLQLNGLSAVLPKIAEPVTMVGPESNGKPVAFKVGQQVRIITIDLEPNDSPAKLLKMKERYIGKLPEAQRAAAREGWTYLAAATPGDGAAIRRVAESVGFKYVYVEDRAEWAHPAALIFLRNTGVVTRYVYGIEFDPAVMRESIIKAGISEPATAVGFLNRCYHFDPDANSHTRAGVLTLRIGAVGFLVLLLSGLGIVHARRRRRVSGES